MESGGYDGVNRSYYFQGVSRQRRPYDMSFRGAR